MISRNDFLLDANGRLDWTALQNFAYRGIHERTVIGEAVTTEFYGAGRPVMDTSSQDLDAFAQRGKTIIWHGIADDTVRSENWDQVGRTTRTRPLCPYPEVARCRGRGAFDDAASFRYRS